MRLAFCLFKYQPYGGLERDFLRVAKACVARGHEVSVYTLRWQGEMPNNMKVTLISVSAQTNHGRTKQFAQKLLGYLEAEKFDLVIGFNRLPGLDIYFAADPCYQKQISERRGLLSVGYRLLPRYRVYVALEKAVFSVNAKTKILLLNPAHQKDFEQYYQTPAGRFEILPPGIAEDRRRPKNQAQLRAIVRQSAGVSLEANILLTVGSNFKVKGVDRALKAFAALPEILQNHTYLWVVGRGKINRMRQSAKKLGILDRVRFWGPREDVTAFYAAADCFLHLAYQETAGMVLIEALVAGLPVMVTANCGYAVYIQAAKAGILFPEPFQQAVFNTQLAELLADKSRLNIFRQQALAYANTHDLFRLTQRFIEIIEDGH